MTFNISLVVHGTVAESSDFQQVSIYLVILPFWFFELTSLAGHWEFIL